MVHTLRACWRYRAALYAQSVADLRSSVIGTRLGYLWWLIDPLLLMAVYYFIVRGVFERGGENYHFFIFCGLVVWQWFARSMVQAANAYTRSKGLILSVPVPLPIYVLSPILVNGIFAIIGLLLLIVVFDPSNLLLLPVLVPLLLLQGTLMFGLGLLLAALTVFVRDAARLVEYGLRIAFYMSPIIYDSARVLASESIPEWIKAVFQLNPFAHLIPAYRSVAIDHGVIDAQPLLVIAALALLLLLASTALTGRLRNQIPQSL